MRRVFWCTRNHGTVSLSSSTGIDRARLPLTGVRSLCRVVHDVLSYATFLSRALPVSSLRV